MEIKAKQKSKFIYSLLVAPYFSLFPSDQSAISKTRLRFIGYLINFPWNCFPYIKKKKKNNTNIIYHFMYTSINFYISERTMNFVCWKE